MERESLRDRTLFIISSFCLYIYIFFFTFFGMASFCGIVIITLSYFLIRKTNFFHVEYLAVAYMNDLFSTTCTCIYGCQFQIGVQRHHLLVFKNSRPRSAGNSNVTLNLL